MKKLKKVTVLLLASVLAFCSCTFASAEAGPDLRALLTPEDADVWIQELFGAHPETLAESWKMTDQMKLAIALSGGMQALAGSLAALGTPEQIASAREEKLQGYTAFFIPCVFPGMSIDLILAVEDGAAAGLSTGPYSGNLPESAESSSFDSLPLSIPVASPAGELPGTLTLPKGDGPFPAVVLVHGSGPNDRDETLVNLKPFRDLAEGLAAQGIAVYRYDKRTYVYREEAAADHQLTLMEETVEDAAAAVQLLAGQEKLDSSRIFVLGHSLGGNAIPAIDQYLESQPVSACGYILMAASPRPLEVLIREQYDYLYSLQPEITPAQQAQKEEVFHELDRLGELDTLPEDTFLAGAFVPYWKWLASYDVLKTAASITEPCLLLQGEEDYQVTMEDFRLWLEAFGESPNWTLLSFHGLTHAFTPGLKTEGSAAYSRQAHVDPDVIQTIADFILCPPTE